MATSNVNEATPIIPRPNTLLPVPDNRSKYQKQLSVYIILASILFERIAFYSLAANLILYLNSEKLHWKSKQSVTALNIFYGK